MNAFTEIGRVTQVNPYPVKSMRGEALESVDLRWSGFDGDRQFAFHKTAEKSRFPWFTARIFSEMVLFTASYTVPASINTSAVRVALPEGGTCDVAAPELCARFSAAAKTDVGLIQVGRGNFDAMPVSVVGQGTLDAVSAAHGRPVESMRFRPNIVIDAGHERDWMDKCLVFGDAETGPRLRVNKPIERCAFITVDPATAARDPKLLRTVVEHFNNQVGAYCVPERLGVLSPGMKVWLA